MPDYVLGAIALIIGGFMLRGVIRAVIGYTAPLDVAMPKYLRHKLIEEGIPLHMCSAGLAAELCEPILLGLDSKRRGGRSRAALIAEGMKSVEFMAALAAGAVFAEQPEEDAWLYPLLRRHRLIVPSGQGACYLMNTPSHRR